MNFYACNVRHNGNMLHSIPKDRVSAHELRILRRMHGEDAVVDVKQVAAEPDPADMQGFYMELAATYGQPVVEKTFGVLLDNFDAWLEARRDRASGLSDGIVAARISGQAEVPVVAGAAPDTPGEESVEPEPAPAPAAAKGRRPSME